jgi:hypothetical protein
MELEDTGAHMTQSVDYDKYSINPVLLDEF